MMGVPGDSNGGGSRIHDADGTTTYKYNFGDWVSGMCNGWTFSQAPLGTASKYSHAELMAYMASRGATVYGANFNGLGTHSYCGTNGTTKDYYVVEIKRVTGGSVQQGYAVQVDGGGTSCDAPSADSCGGGDGGFGPFSVRDHSWADVSADYSGCYMGCEVSGVRALGPGMNKDPDGTLEWTVWVDATGEECPAGESGPTTPTPPQEEAEPPPSDDGENCVVSDAGVEVCSSWDPQRSNENCGYVNDEFTCLDKVSNDNCWVMPSGGRLCGEGATPPTAPTAPAPAPKGQTATPTDQLASNTTNNTYNYYNSSVVGSSQRPVTPDGSNPITGSPGAAGDGEGEEEGSGTASGGETCATPPSCSGDPIQCAVLNQQWRNRCQGEPTDAELEAAFGPVENEEGELFGTQEHTIPESLNSTGWMGTTAECMDDLTIDMGSLLGNVTIPFSELCWLINAIGIFVMISSYVSAARILVGGI